MNILVVEDSHLVACFYEYLFNELAIPYCLAKNGQEALQFYKEMHFDLLLCDFYLPDMNGFDLCKELHALGEQKEKKRIPILLISGEKDEIMKDPRAVKYFDDWLQKPLTEEKLKNILATYKTTEH